MYKVSKYLLLELHYPLELEISFPVTGGLPQNIHILLQFLLKRNWVSTLKASPFLLVSYVLLNDYHFPEEMESWKAMRTGGVSFYHWCSDIIRLTWKHAFPMLSGTCFHVVSSTSGVSYESLKKKRRQGKGSLSSYGWLVFFNC